MTLFEALYERLCHSLVCWNKLDDVVLLGLDLVRETYGKVKLAWERIRIAQSRHKSYTDWWHRARICCGGLCVPEGISHEEFFALEGGVNWITAMWDSFCRAGAKYIISTSFVLQFVMNTWHIPCRLKKCLRGEDEDHVVKAWRVWTNKWLHLQDSIGHILGPGCE